MTAELTGTHWPLLGTTVDLRIGARVRAEAVRAERIVCDEIARLEHIFSVYDPTSMLNRWIVDPTITRSDELDELLSLAWRWQHRSNGAFNVGTRHLRDLWARAASEGRFPRAEELHDRVAAMAEAPYRCTGLRPEQVGDCSALDLNAIAKGYIVDRASDAAWRCCELDALTVNAGGDIAHRGPLPIEIGIADPTHTIDNAPPLRTVSLQNAAVATSGSARRGVSVDGEWIGHVLDPRTGHSADAIASATVVAANAATADVVATILGVLEPDAGLAFVDSLNSSDPAHHPPNPLAAPFERRIDGPIECWIVDRLGTVRTSTACR